MPRSEEDAIESRPQVGSLSRWTNDHALAAVRELVRTIVRVDLVAYDFKGVECNRKHYKAGPGDTIKWRRMVHRMVRLDAVAYDAEGHEIYRNEYRVLPGQDFTYIVAMPEDVHFELT